MVKHCPNCKRHEFQDATYGLDNRVHNLSRKGWVCTVCLDVKGATSEESKELSPKKGATKK